MTFCRSTLRDEAINSIRYVAKALLMTEEQHCLRCDGQTLVSVESPKDKGITFFECPKCKRHYTLAEGRTLTDRWLSPITLPLYSTIFSSNPPEDAERVALQFLETRVARTVTDNPGGNR